MIQTTNPMWRSAPAIVLAVGVLFTGCRSAERPGQAVSGFVIVDGEPLHLGSITFKPIDRTSGPKVTTQVREGDFQFPPEHGPWPGTFQVLIAATPPDVEAFLNHEDHDRIRHAARQPVRMIAREFNSESKLRATVTPEHENVLQFEVSWAKSGHRPEFGSQRH